jgi:hypothetical protein
MKKNYFSLVLLFLTSIIIISCGSVDVQYVGTQPMGYYEVIMNYNGDSDYHMGQLYAKALVSQYPDLEAKYADHFSNPGNFAVDYEEIITRVQQIKNQIPKEYRDFLNGVASQYNGGTTNNKDDHLLSVDEIFYFSLLPVINRSSQCSVIAVYNTTSDTGKPIIGRLLDWGFGSTASAVSYIKKGNKVIMNIGANLFDQGIMTALNKHGIFVAVLDSSRAGTTFPDLSSDTFYAYPLDLRYALENYSTIDDIAHYLSQKKYTFNHLILIGDSKTVKVLENDLEGTRALRDADSELNTGITWGFPDAIGAVNAFLLKNNHDNFSANYANTYRWQSIKDQLNLYLSSDNKITVNEMKKITTYYGTDISQFVDGGIMNAITQQIIIYDSKTPGLHVFFRNKRAIGTENNETSFDVDNPEFLVIPVHF